MSTPSLRPIVAPRIHSIDILRGLTIAFMILVNDPGDYQQIFPILDHAEWNGYTPADVIFPNFLFLAGASLVFSLHGRIRSGSARLPLARALGRRTVNLLLLMLFLAGLPTFRYRRVRIFGVLFRTAVCSLAVGLILLVTLSVPILLALIASLLALYWVALRFLPIPGLGRPIVDQPLLDPDNNLAAWLDREVARFFRRQLHTGALYNLTHDPEGLLSSVPATATMLIGSCAALLMLSGTRTPAQKASLLTFSGLASLSAGHLWHRSFPINKNLWTSSYVLATAGWSLLALAALYTLFDIKKIERSSPAARALAQPAKIFGANAIVVYAVSVSLAKIARTVHLQHHGHSLSLRTFVYRKLFAPTRSTPARSLAFAITFAAVCFLPNLVLWRKKIFVKI